MAAQPYTPPPGYRIVDVRLDEHSPWGNLSHRRVERIDATAPHHLRVMATPEYTIRRRRLRSAQRRDTTVLVAALLLVVCLLYGGVCWSLGITPWGAL